MITQTMAMINALENPKAKQLGAMILAASPGGLAQLWARCTPGTVLGWMAKSAGQLSIMDKIEVRAGGCGVGGGVSVRGGAWGCPHPPWCSGGVAARPGPGKE
jgi:hypothetical protein